MTNQKGQSDVPHLQLNMWMIRSRPPKVTQHTSINPVGNATAIAMASVLDNCGSPPPGIIVTRDDEMSSLELSEIGESDMMLVTTQSENLSSFSAIPATVL